MEHRVSSPHYPRSNGHAEAAVKSVKKLILTTTQRGQLDEDAFARGLLELRNTPRAEGRSPAQVLFGHPMRSCVPAHHLSYAQQWQRAADVCDAKAEHLRRQAKLRHDASARTLPPLHLGGHVDVQDHATGLWDRVGVIVGVGRRRDYLIKMGSGRVMWRNRRFLRPHKPLAPIPVQQHTAHGGVALHQGHEEHHHPGSPERQGSGVYHSQEQPARRGSRQRREPRRLQVRWHRSTYD